eukprot:4776938-Lingulodinium_polyedra.AAC.1
MLWVPERPLTLSTGIGNCQTDFLRQGKAQLACWLMTVSLATGSCAEDAPPPPAVAAAVAIAPPPAAL